MVCMITRKTALRQKTNRDQSSYSGCGFLCMHFVLKLALLRVCSVKLKIFLVHKIKSKCRIELQTIKATQCCAYHNTKLLVL